MIFICNIYKICQKLQSHNNVGLDTGKHDQDFLWISTLGNVLNVGKFWLEKLPSSERRVDTFKNPIKGEFPHFLRQYIFYLRFDSVIFVPIRYPFVMQKGVFRDK